MTHARIDDIADVTSFTLEMKNELRREPEALFDLGAYRSRTTTTITGSFTSATAWVGDEFQIVLREPVVLSWHQDLWRRLRHLPVPTVEAIRLVGKPQRTATTLDEDATETTVSFTARDLVFTVVPDYSWRTKIRRAWFRVWFRVRVSA